VLHGGNFYGGHVCFAMDGLKIAIASVADLLDRQMVLLCNPVTNNGLPADLVGAGRSEKFLHHGFKAMQIATSALAAEAQKLTVPASAFSRSTESHNQDKVSMGTIAARDCLRVLDLTEQISVMLLLACCQAMDLRDREGCHDAGLALHAAVRKSVPFNTADRRQDRDIAAMLDEYRCGVLPVGAFGKLVGGGS
jgi:histidine ammonia-lyase